MASVKVEMEVLGEVQLRRRLLRFSDRAVNARPAFAVISEYLNEVEKKQFASEGAYSGHPWAPLAESTKKTKASRGQRPEILRATDAMKKALTNKRGPNKKLVMTRSMLIQGVKGLDYPEIHMAPSTSTHTQRRPVDLTEANKVACVKIVQLWITRGATLVVHP